MLVRAASIVPAARVILNVLPASAATDVDISLQAIPVIQKLVTITVALGAQAPETMRDINTAQGINTVPVPVPAVAVPGGLGLLGRGGMYMMTVVHPNTVPAAAA